MIEPILTLLLGILVILAIIAANGYFVAQEFAYMAVDRTRLAARAAEGDASAKLALDVTNRTSFMLSGAQLGITVTGLLVGYVAEPLVGESLGALLGGTGVPTEVGVTVGTVLALAAATVIQMIFGELYPKNLAIADPEPLARGLARSTLLYMTVFGWLISLFDKSANLLLRALRIEPVHDLDVSASADDLPHIIADSRHSGDLPLELSLMMDRILDFPQRDVEHASWAIAHPERSALAIGIISRAYVWPLRPLLSWVNHIANRLVKATGVEPVESVAVGGQDIATIRQLVEHSAKVGTLKPQMQQQISGLIDLGTLPVEALLAADKVPTHVAQGATVADVHAAAVQSGHLRILLLGPHGATPSVVHVRDTLLEPPARSRDARRHLEASPAGGRCGVGATSFHPSASVYHMYPTYPPSSTAPSPRLSRRPVCMNQGRSTAAPSMTHWSNCRIRALTANGCTSAATPRIPSRLKILLPRILPIATSACRRSAAITETVNSGSDVPTATSVRPITACETPQCSAIPTAPVTSSRDPPMSKASPAMIAVTVSGVERGSATISLASAAWTSPPGAPCMTSLR